MIPRVEHPDQDELGDLVLLFPETNITFNIRIRSCFSPGIVSGVDQTDDVYDGFFIRWIIKSDECHT